MGADIQAESALSPSDINTAINGEPRIHDLRLAEALEFDRPRDIRKLITRHRSTLETFGHVVCATVAQTSKGGRPADEYWLTERQALYLCTKSEAPNAVDLTIEMVNVFHAVKSGQTGTVNVRAHTRRKPSAKQVALDEAGTRLETLLTEMWRLRIREQQSRSGDAVLCAVAYSERHHAAKRIAGSLKLVGRA